jgi:osmoprotectant transport system permease protein
VNWDWVVQNTGYLGSLLAGHAIVLGLSLAAGVVIGIPLGYLLAKLRVGPGFAPVLDLLSYASPFGLLLIAPILRGTAIDDRANLVLAFGTLAILRICRSVLFAYRQHRPTAPYAYLRAAGLGGATRFRLDVAYLAPRVLGTIGRVAVATVVLITIGGAIVSAKFGPGGELGSLIYRGLDARDLTQAVTGLALVAVLAILVDLIFRGLRRIAATDAIEEVAA